MIQRFIIRFGRFQSIWAPGLALKWSLIGSVLRSPMSRGALLVPVAGYVVLYSEQFETFFSFPGISTYAWFSPYIRALLIYFGGLFVLASWIMFLVSSPRLVKKHRDAFDCEQQFLSSGTRSDIIAAVEGYFENEGGENERLQFSSHFKDLSQIVIHDYWPQLVVLLNKPHDIFIDWFKVPVASDKPNIEATDREEFADWWHGICSRSLPTEPRTFFDSVREKVGLPPISTARSFKGRDESDVIPLIAELCDRTRGDPVLWNTAGKSVHGHYGMLDSTKPTTRRVTTTLIAIGAIFLLLPAVETLVRILYSLLAR